MRLIQHYTPRSKKVYECCASAYLHLREQHLAPSFTFEEQQAMIDASRNGWCIKKGHRYVSRAIVDDERRAYTFRAIPEIHQICVKYGLYK